MGLLAKKQLQLIREQMGIRTNGIVPTALSVENTTMGFPQTPHHTVRTFLWSERFCSHTTPAVATYFVW